MIGAALALAPAAAIASSGGVPPGLPTVRAFQAAQGVIALEWLRQRLGWS